MDQFEEAKETNQKWKYSNERTSESWRKVEATAMGSQGSSLKKIESKVEKSAVMIVHVLSGWPTSSYPIRRALVQHISQRVSVESVINERKNSCHFAWRNGSSTAAWMFVHTTNTAVILDYFLAVVPFVAFPIFQQLQEKKRAAKKFSPLWRSVLRA